MSLFPEVKIGSVCTLINGRAFKPSDWAKSGLPIVRIQNLNDPDCKFNYFNGEVKEQFLIDLGELLFSWSGTPGTSFGAFFWNQGKAVLNQHIFRVLVNKDRVDKGYFRYALNYRIDRIIAQSHGGVGLKHITKGKLEATKVPLPPLEEQRRIAAILDKADAVRRKRQSAIALTEELLRSAFLEMFGDPGKNPHQWTTSCIGNIAEFVTDGTHQTPIRSDNGVMLLSARNIKNGHINISEDVDFVPQYEYERLRQSYDPKQQDVLISCSGSVGRVTVVRDFGSFSMVRSVAVVRPKLEFINSEFFESLLHSAYLRASMVKGTKQSSQANLFQGAIKELPIILPPLYLQEQWQTFKLRVREAAKRYSQMQDSQTELFNSLLQKAFRGQL